jgi:hypothetical protein
VYVQQFVEVFVDGSTALISDNLRHTVLEKLAPLKIKGDSFRVIMQRTIIPS